MESFFTGKTHLVLVLDRSGSMADIQDEVIGGLNHFIDEQKKTKDDTRVSCVLFDDQYEFLFKDLSLDEVPTFTRENFVPRGMTALNDALNRAISETEAVRADGDRVLMHVVTDGLENASKEVTPQALKERVLELGKRSDWTITYMSSDIEAFASAGNIGINIGNTVRFAKGGRSATNAFTMTAQASSVYRGSTAMKVDNLYDGAKTATGDLDEEKIRALDEAT